MKAIFLGGARDGQTHEVEKPFPQLNIPYIHLESAARPYDEIERDEDGCAKTPSVAVEAYVLDRTLEDGTLVYGCVGTVEGTASPAAESWPEEIPG